MILPAAVTSNPLGKRLLLLAVMAAIALLAPVVAPGGAPVGGDDAREPDEPAPARRSLRLPYVFAFVDRLTVGFFVYAFPMYAARELGLDPGIDHMSSMALISRVRRMTGAW